MLDQEFQDYFPMISDNPEFEKLINQTLTYSIEPTSESEAALICRFENGTGFAMEMDWEKEEFILGKLYTKDHLVYDTVGDELVFPRTIQRFGETEIEDMLNYMNNVKDNALFLESPEELQQQISDAVNIDSETSKLLIDNSSEIYLNDDHSLTMFFENDSVVTISFYQDTLYLSAENQDTGHYEDFPIENTEMLKDLILQLKETEFEDQYDLINTTINGQHVLSIDDFEDDLNVDAFDSFRNGFVLYTQNGRGVCVSPNFDAETEELIGYKISSVVGTEYNYPPIIQDEVIRYNCPPSEAQELINDSLEKIKDLSPASEYMEDYEYAPITDSQLALDEAGIIDLSRNDSDFARSLKEENGIAFFSNNGRGVYVEVDPDSVDTRYDTPYTANYTIYSIIKTPDIESGFVKAEVLTEDLNNETVRANLYRNMTDISEMDRPTADEIDAARHEYMDEKIEAENKVESNFEIEM